MRKGKKYQTKKAGKRGQKRIKKRKLARISEKKKGGRKSAKRINTTPIRGGTQLSLKGELNHH